MFECDNHSVNVSINCKFNFHKSYNVPDNEYDHCVIRPFTHLPLFFTPGTILENYIIIPSMFYTNTVIVNTVPAVPSFNLETTLVLV